MRKGFTLVELSVALVIIGLLLGGILAGKSMISSSKSNALVKEYTQYKLAMINFRTAYAYLPGDIPNGRGFTNSLQADGSGCIDNWNTEGAYVWTHLYQAKMLERAYTPGTDFRVNFPESANYKNRGFYFSGSGWGHACSSPGDTGNQLYLGWRVPGSNSAYTALTGEETLALDVKMDDGVIDSGEVQGMNAWMPSGATLGRCQNYGYTNLAASDNQCLVYFRPHLSKTLPL